MQRNIKTFLFISVLISWVCIFSAWNIYKDFFYFKKDYSQGFYSQALDNHVDEDVRMLHNFWNAALWNYFSSEISDSKILEEALSYYSGSLNISEHPDTRYNYNVVTSLLENITQNEEQTSQEQQSWSWSKSQDNEWWEEDKNEEEQWESGAPIKNQREEWYTLWDEQKITEMSEAEKKELEEITQQLKTQQIYNQKYYNKQEQWSNFQNSFESFFGDINRGGEKDW